MVDAQPIEHAARRVQAAQPPAELVAPHFFPVIQGVAPALAVGAEIVRGHARHAQGGEVLSELEKLRFGPGVGGIFGHIDGHIAKQGDALLIYIFAQRAPLAEKQPLAVAVEISVLLEGRGVHAAEILIFAGPLCPQIAAAGVLDGGVKGVSVQPVDGVFAVRRPALFFRKGAHVALHLGKRLRKGQAQKPLLLRAHGGEVRAGGVAAHFRQLRIQKSFFAQKLQINEHRVACVRRAGLIGRFPIAGGADGQHLPHAQPGFFHKVGKGERRLAQRAYAAGRGQGSDVHQYAALTHSSPSISMFAPIIHRMGAFGK